MVAVPVRDAEVPASVGRLFAEQRDALRLPFTPALFRTLARWPSYLEHVWPQLVPAVETSGFRGSSLYLGAMAREAIDQFYEPGFDPESLTDSGVSDASIPSIVGMLEVLQFANPQSLLLAGALAEGLEKPTVGGMGRPEPRELTELEARVRVYPWRAPEEADLPADLRDTLEDVKTILGLPFLTDDFRAIACWPPLLEQSWAELRELRVYKLFRQRGRALYYYARSSAKFLAQPISVSRERLAEIGLSGDDIHDIGEVLRMFCGILPNHIMNNAAMLLAFGVPPPQPPAPPPRRT